MEKKLSGNAFPKCFEQETHVRHIVHDGLRRTRAIRIKITHCGSEEHVVQRRGQLFGRTHAEKFLHLLHIATVLHGSVLLSVKLFFGEKGKMLECVMLFAQLQTTVLKPCLNLLHIEKFTAHIPLSFPVAERLGIIAYQSVERVHGLSESLAVVVAAYPLLAPQTEQAAVIHYQLAVGDADKECIHLDTETGVKPLGEAHGYPVIGTPSSGFAFSTSFANNNQIFGSDSSKRTFVLLVETEGTNVLSLIDFVCAGLQILYHVLLLQPVFREFPKRFSHSGKVSQQFSS